MKKFFIIVGIIAVVGLGTWFVGTGAFGGREIVIRGLFVETPTPIPAPSSFIVVGDVMLDRNVAALTAQYGEDYPFEKIDPLFRGVDGVLANLEGPITSDHVPTKSGSFQFSFASSSADVLKRHNIQAVSLGNNHLVDHGQKGFKEAQAYLSSASISFAGHPSKIDAESVGHFVVGNVPITFLSFNATWPAFRLAEAVSLVKREKAASPDFLITMMHWGDEYKLHSNKTQQDIAHALIDAGADAVFGAHPHVVQEIELYNDKPIFYSLGNFIFDQYFSKDTQQGLAVKLEFLSDRIWYSLMPIQSAHSQPAQMNDAERDAFLSTLAGRTEKELVESVQAGALEVPY